MEEKELLATIANDVKWIKQSLANKADKWVENGMKAVATFIVLYFLGGLLGLFKIIPITTAFANIFNTIV